MVGDGTNKTLLVKSTPSVDHRETAGRHEQCTKSEWCGVRYYSSVSAIYNH